MNKIQIKRSKFFLTLSILFLSTPTIVEAATKAEGFAKCSRACRSVYGDEYLKDQGNQQPYVLCMKTCEEIYQSSSGQNVCDNDAVLLGEAMCIKTESGILDLTNPKELRKFCACLMPIITAEVAYCGPSAIPKAVTSECIEKQK